MSAAPIVLVVALSLPFLAILLRRPVLRRLALRNAVRRPREAALVVLGSLLGAAIITGSMVVGDTMNASIRQVARTHLGPIDELVTARGPEDQQDLLRALRTLDRSDVDGVLAFASIDVATTSAGPHVLAVPRSQLLGLDFAAARRFGDDPASTGIAGGTPGLGRAAISADLARSLRIGVGDRVSVHAYGAHTSLVVDRVLPRRGIAGYWLGGEQEANNVLVSWPTFDRIRAASGGGAPPRWSVAVSNRGGIESGARSTDAVLAQIDDVTRAAGLHAEVYAAKRTTLDTAEAFGKGFSSMFTAMGSFGVLAGLLLLVNLFVMLAAERKTELGMARAVGMRRSELVGAFATEGWLYALAATTLGVVAGIGLGGILVAISARIFSTEHNRFDLFFTIKPESLANAFAIGFTVALATIVGTSLRVSRLNIIRAIRDLAEPPARRQRLRWLVAGLVVAAAGVALTVPALSSHDGFALLLGPTLIVVGLAPLAARFVDPPVAHSAAATLVVVWGATLFALVPDSTKGASVLLYVAQGIVLTAAAVTLVSLQQERVSRTLRAVTGGRSLSLRLGLAYPLARRSRTGLTIAMYALVVFILTFITALAHMIDSEVATATTRVRGGYDIIVTSSAANPVEAKRMAALDGVVRVAPLARATGFFRVAGMTTDAPWPVTAFDERFVAGGAPRLEDRGDYPTDRAAWQAVLRDPRLAIVDTVFLQESGGPSHFTAAPGARISIKDPYTGRSRELTVAAVAPGDYFIENGVFYGLDGARTLFGYPLALDRLYVGLRPGVDDDLFAEEVQASFLRNGTEAVAIRTIMAEGFTMTNQIFRLFEGYLAMGLIVGIAGTAVVMIRAVRERRRQIGTLRALGFGKRSVGRSFAIETAMVAVEGTLIGASLALVTLYDIVAMSDSFGQMSFSIPYVPLAVLLLGTVAASLLATVWPTVAASRIRPAVALRMTD
ncbi:MAG TPA: FtsX-like permease family protein [Gaiellaceae bacterium]|nr:FtsX-like permease family protein [Gaiellaceae bacterium]